jgi:CHRD domain-containing protein
VNSLRVKLAVGVAVAGIAGIGTAAVAHDKSRLQAFMQGYEEVPAISTKANGVFKASISRNSDEIRYTLTYSGPFNAGATPGTVTQAHIHLGQMSVNGGIAAWLCANNPPITNAPAGTQPCPPNGGTISGTIKPADVVAIPDQGLAAGEFAELVRALRAGVAYANVHTTTHGGGEIRGQISDDDRDRGH